MRVYIAAIQRSAVGKYLGTLADVAPKDLAAQVIEDTVKKSGVAKDAFDEVILGNVLSAGHGQNVARQAMLVAQFPEEIPAYSINMVCGSGLKTIMQAFNDIKAGEADVVLAGGVESMSQAAFVAPSTMRGGTKMGDLTMRDTILSDGLLDALGQYHMGITAENVAQKYDITREEQDAFAFESQERAKKAIAEGAFKDEITPITVKTRKEEITFDTDEHPNPKSTLEKLATLRPAFKKEGGTVTAGNASGINDGAAIAVVVSETAVKKYGLKPLVEIISTGQHGVAPETMGLGPTGAIEKALEKTDLSLKDIDVLELNEAFAAQSLGVLHELSEKYGVSKEWILERTNIHGGAIAIGHPLGASGARIATTLIHEMVKSGKKYGLASLCIGGGQGVATIFKAVDEQ